MGCPSESELFTLYMVTASCALCSFLGCLFIMLIYAIAKDLRVYAFKLVAWLAFCDSIKSLALILPGYSGVLGIYTCDIQGFLLDSFSLSNLVWIQAISFCLQKVVISNEEHVEVYHKYWLALSFIVCPIIAALPFLSNEYGSLYSWCTLKIRGTSELWRIFVDYAPRWGTIIIIAWRYLKIYRHIKRNTGMFADAIAQHEFLTRMITYPAIIFIAYIPLTVLRLLQSFSVDECGYFILAIIAYVCFGSYGFLNALAYGYNESISQYVKGLCIKGNKLSRPRGTDLFKTLSEGINY